MVKKELINRFDLTALQDSFSESAMAAACPKEYWRKPTYVEYVRDQNPFEGITIFTDKQLHRVVEVDSTYKVAIIQEPRELLPWAYEEIVIYEDHYDLILTFDIDLLRRGKNYVFCPGDTAAIRTEGCKVHKKTKLVSFPYSLKTQLFGHKLRHIIAKDIIPKLNLSYDIDYYGAGVGNFVDDKLETLQDYMFQIATENVKKEFYFTDKILDCAITGTVPIYWGPDNIGNFFNKKGILQFNHPDELVEILSNLSEETYQEMLPHIQDNFERAKYYMIQDDFFYDIIKKGLDNNGKNI
jgi:hypothetical protein|tara:strand:- start:522 stop:1412 length:891 start_codon:yes stop_codon:yes gene_type:complete